MKKNKGFTLIEVLAAIIVLGALSAIIIPKITQTIKESKKNTYINSAQALVDSFENYVVDLKQTLTPFEGCTYDIAKNRTTCKDFEFNGKKPDDGNIQIDRDGNITGIISFDKFNFLIENNDISLIYYKDDYGTEYSYEYTGTIQTFNVPKSGYYKLEVWGAQGGNADSYLGGYGGYSKGFIKLEKDDTLYVVVGGAGTSISDNETNGGYNGGGSAKTSSRNDSAGSGGGATHIAFVTGKLSELVDNKNSVIIVAGGGGGAYSYRDTFSSSGGHGGGIYGELAPTGYCDGRDLTIGIKASSINPGTNNSCPPSNFETYSASFGTGGEYTDTWYAGGGGGYYGGGFGFAHGGNGGSGYIENKLLINKLMYCYECEESSDVETRTISTTNISIYPISEYAKIGNGFAKITFIDATK